MIYLNKASAGLALSEHPEDDFLFIVRSGCHCKLGDFEKADADANKALSIDEYNVKGLMAKAEAQYNLGRFEHALKFFWR